MKHWGVPLAGVGALVLLCLFGWQLVVQGSIFESNEGSASGDPVRDEPAAPLRGRREAPVSSGTEDAETDEPEHLVIGGERPGRDDVLVRILGPGGKPIHRAHWTVSDVITRRRVHRSYVDAGKAYIPRDLVPYRAKVSVRPSPGARSRGVLDAELDSVDLLTLGEIRLVRGRLLMGVVRDALGREEEGIQVGAFVTWTVAGRRDGHGGRTKTDLDGVYRLFVPHGEDVHLWASSNRVDRARVEVLVTADGEAPDVTLPPEVTLRVEVHDGSGEPVFGVRVELSMPFDDGSRTHRAEDRTDGEGIAAFHGLPGDGVGKLVIRTPTEDHPYLPYQLDRVHVDRGEIRIGLRRGVDITGRVRRTDGPLVSRGRVSAAPVDPSLNTAMSVPIEADGTFAIRGLRRGPYRITAWGEPKDGWGGSEPLEVEAPSQAHELVVQRTYSIRGTFEQPVAGFLRAYWWGGASEQVKPVGRRGFQLSGLPADKGLLYIGAPGDPRYAYRHVKTEDGELGVLKIHRGQCISGRIHGLTRDSRQLPGGGVQFVQAQVVLRLEGPVDFVVPDIGLDGRFQTLGLPPGSYYLMLWDAREEKLIDESDALEPGASATLQFR